MDVSSPVVWELLSQLWTAAQYVKRAADKQDADPILMRLLGLVAHRDGARPSEIASSLEVAQPSVSRYVRALEEAGLVSVAGDPHDGRSYLVQATEAGHVRLDEFRAALVDRFADVLDGWDEREVSTLTGSLARLNESMGRVQAQRQRAPKGQNRWRAADEATAGRSNRKETS